MRVCVREDACVYVSSCVYGGGAGGEPREEEKETDRTNLRGPLGNAYAVTTANLREMSITLSTSESFMKASGLYQSLHLTISLENTPSQSENQL